MKRLRSYILMESGVLLPMLAAALILGILMGCGIAVWTMAIRGLM